MTGISRAEERNAKTNRLIRVVVVLALIVLLVTSTAAVVLQVLAIREADEDRKRIDERNIEVTVIIGECLTVYRNEPLRECVKNRLNGLEPP